MDKFVLLKFFAILASYLMISLPAASATSLGFAFFSSEYSDTETSGEDYLGLASFLIGLFFPSSSQASVQNNDIPVSNEHESGNRGVISFQGAFVGDGLCNNITTGGTEDSGNACYDCGCNNVNGPGIDYYCDGEGSPDAWSCRHKPTEFDAQITNLDPPIFQEYRSQNKVQMDYTITNYPQRTDVGVTSVACGIAACSKIDPISGIPDDCSADVSCTVNCVAGQVDPSTGTYSDQCELDFNINGHNPLFFYIVSPRLDIEIELSQPAQPSIELSKTMTDAVRFMQYLCGDGNVNTGETGQNCCFDVGCGGDEYCYTQDPLARPQSGSCTAESGIVLGVSASGTEFFDATKEHTVTLEATISNKPGGLSVSTQRRCKFFDIDSNEVSCESLGIQITNCQEKPAGINKYKLECEMKIPPIDFMESDFFDSSQGKIIFRDGELILPVSFNSGASIIQRQLTANLGTFSIEIQTSCPDTECGFDEHFGEANECPADCNDCPAGQILIREANGGRGACLQSDLAGLQITRIEPSPVPCIISMDSIDLNQFGGGGAQQLLSNGGRCKPDPINIFATITGVPADVSLLKSQYVINRESFDALCHSTGVGNEFVCPVTLKTIEGSSAQQNIELVFTVAFITSAGAPPVTGQVTANANVQVSSPAAGSSGFSTAQELAQSPIVLLSCQEEQKRLDKKIKGLEKKSNALLIIVGILAGIVATACIICVLSAGSDSGGGGGAGGGGGGGSASGPEGYDNGLGDDFGSIHFNIFNAVGDGIPEEQLPQNEKIASFSGAACAICKIGGIITTCISAPLLFGVGNIQDKIGKLQQDKAEACAATTAGGMKSAQGKTSGTISKIGGAVAAIICIAGIVSMAANAGSTAAAATSSTETAGGTAGSVPGGLGQEIGSDFGTPNGPVGLGAPA